ncbi:MAG: hypothetical protein R2852_03735 [Bacteroidia bacterium]
MFKNTDEFNPYSWQNQNSHFKQSGVDRNSSSKTKDILIAANRELKANTYSITEANRNANVDTK